MVANGTHSASSSTRVKQHGFLKRCRQGALTRQDVIETLGQYWHLLHYFPTFLAGMVEQAPSLEHKTPISKILYQELGEGEARLAHESLFIQTLDRVHLPTTQICHTDPSPETTHLLDYFKSGAKDFYLGLGHLLATETTDLPIVASLGAAITAETGQSSLEWVDIHVKQEPDHVIAAGSAFDRSVDETTQTAYEEGLERWGRFFDGLERRTTVPTSKVQAELRSSL